MLVVFLGAGMGVSAQGRAGRPERQPSTPQERTAWVLACLTRMQTVHPGMTRADLLQVFLPEGGLSTGLERTYVSRDCPYFKVDVGFQAVGRPDRDKEGRITLVESGQDIITKISRPYLALSTTD